MAVAREIRERDGLKLYRNSLSRRLLGAEGNAAMLRDAVREFPDLLYFDLWRHPSGTLMLCRTDSRPDTLAKAPKAKGLHAETWSLARADSVFAQPAATPVPAMARQPGASGQLAFF